MQPETQGSDWQVDQGCDEAARVTTPSLTTSNRTAPVGANGAVVAASYETTASGENILKCISTVEADLQHATVKA
jgi:hypothetical protein